MAGNPTALGEALEGGCTHALAEADLSTSGGIVMPAAPNAQLVKASSTTLVTAEGKATESAPQQQLAPD